MARYNVIDRNEAANFGFKTDGEFNKFALVSMMDEKVDGLVCWGFKRENLQTIADKRNADMEMTKRMVGEDTPAVDPLIGLI